MIEVTVKYGLSKTATVDIDDGSTISDILRNQNLKMLLGFPESVSAVCDGVTLSPNDEVNDGDVIQLEKQAAAKAA